MMRSVSAAVYDGNITGAIINNELTQENFKYGRNIYYQYKKTELHSREILQFLECKFLTLKINFDLQGFKKPYPCRNFILRIEGKLINPNLIPLQLKSKGLECQIFNNNLCKK